MYFPDFFLQLAFLFDEVKLVSRKHNKLIYYYVKFFEDSSRGHIGECIFLAEFHKKELLLRIRNINEWYDDFSIEEYWNDAIKLLNNDIKTIEDFYTALICSDFRKKLEQNKYSFLIEKLFEIYFLKEIFNNYNKK